MLLNIFLISSEFHGSDFLYNSGMRGKYHKLVL